MSVLELILDRLFVVDMNCLQPLVHPRRGRHDPRRLQRI
jgi:hypothetical protein